MALAPSAGFLSPPPASEVQALWLLPSPGGSTSAWQARPPAAHHLCSLPPPTAVPPTPMLPSWLAQAFKSQPDSLTPAPTPPCCFSMLPLFFFFFSFFGCPAALEFPGPRIRSESLSRHTCSCGNAESHPQPPVPGGVGDRTHIPARPRRCRSRCATAGTPGLPLSHISDDITAFQPLSPG